MKDVSARAVSQGVSVEELTEQFYLTEYSIRRIIRKEKQVI